MFDNLKKALGQDWFDVLIGMVLFLLCLVALFYMIKVCFAILGLFVGFITTYSLQIMWAGIGAIASSVITYWFFYKGISP